jgi:hypothetical protein
VEEDAGLHKHGDPGMERCGPSPLRVGTIHSDRQAGPAQLLGHLSTTSSGAKAPNRRRSPPGTPGTAATWGVGGSKGRVALLRRRPRTATHPWSLSARTVASGATNGAPPSLCRGGPRSARVPLPPQPRGPPRLGHDNTRSLSKARQLTTGPTLTHDPHGSGAAHAPARPQVPSCVSRARRSLRRSLGGSVARHVGRETRGA